MEITKKEYKWGRSVIFLRKSCLQCSRLFWARKDQLNKGFSRFCCSKCFGKSISKSKVKKCIFCKKEMLFKPSAKRIFCERKCYLKARIDFPDKFNPTWKGGRMTTKDGYVLVKLRNYPFTIAKNGYIPEHRLVMEQSIGRPLKPKEVVHHKNGIRTDNRIENLELWCIPSQPIGQRVEDKINWAIEFLKEYGYKSTLI